MISKLFQRPLRFFGGYEGFLQKLYNEFETILTNADFTVQRCKVRLLPS